LNALAREPEPPPVPPGAVASDVWAPYWTLDDRLLEFDYRFDDVREVSPFWLDTVGVDDIVANENASGEGVVQFVAGVDSSARRLVPSLSDAMPPGAMAEILADPTTRAGHVAAIVDFASSMDADGVDVNYERFAFFDGRDTWSRTRPGWVAFDEELAAALHDDDRTLTVSVPAVWGLAASAWSRCGC
jgi:hypothetical protein